MELIEDAREWCNEQFASADFGNLLRARRAGSMLRRILERPAGRVTEVFDDDAEQQAAYNFVEGETPVEAIVEALAQATLRQIADDPFVYVPLDGTSLTLTDRLKSKGFGSVGRRQFPTRGLKVIDAIAVRPDGTPMGLLGLEWWARSPRTSTSRARRRRRGETEVRHWVGAIEHVDTLFAESTCKPWFVIDAEGDAADILRALTASTRHFTVRVSQRDRFVIRGNQRLKLGQFMRRRRRCGTREVLIPKAPGRRARIARLEIRSARLQLEIPVNETGGRMTISVGVVWATERHAPFGEKKIDWMLLTDQFVDTLELSSIVLDGYCHRWRIEDFHRSWKSGACNVEDTQLRAMDHVLRWATLLAAVATRIEQLKHLARTRPETLASEVFSDIEIRALIAYKRSRKKRTETIPDTVPTIGTAVLWLAQLGGYTGKSSGGPPGSITIGRGLQRHAIWADAFGVSEKLHRKT